MAIDGRVDMLKVRTYRGEQHLFLERADGGIQSVARFVNEEAELVFWEWHSSRTEGILEEVLEVLDWPEGVEPRLRKIITGRGD